MKSNTSGKEEADSSLNIPLIILHVNCRSGLNSAVTRQRSEWIKNHGSAIC